MPPDPGLAEADRRQEPSHLVLPPAELSEPVVMLHLARSLFRSVVAYQFLARLRDSPRYLVKIQRNLEGRLELVSTQTTMNGVQVA